MARLFWCIILVHTFAFSDGGNFIRNPVDHTGLGATKEAQPFSLKNHLSDALGISAPDKDVDFNQKQRQQRPAPKVMQNTLFGTFPLLLLGGVSCAAAFFSFTSAKGWKEHSTKQSPQPAGQRMPVVPGVNPQYRFRTNLGEFVIELFIVKMPITCYNFMDLADSGFYTGLHFHRVAEEYIIQTGCPFSRNPADPRCGTGAPPPYSRFMAGKWPMTRHHGGSIPDEHNTHVSNEPGVVSMANAGVPNTGGSQFFINVGYNPELDWFRGEIAPYAHPAFGRVIRGFEVCIMISEVEIDETEKPTVPVKIISVERIR
eukprot:EG_transcript_14492